MPRQQFQADLEDAVQGVAIAGIANVQPGSDDGEFTFTCLAEGQPLSISVLIPELSDYPSAHQCMIFGADNASASVAAALDDISGTASGRTILQILELISITLESMDRDGDRQMLNSQGLDEFDDDDEVDEYFPGDEELDPRPLLSNKTSEAGSGFTESTPAFRQRVRDDILTAKREGFKTGHIGDIIDGLACYISISIRISKLGLSEEAMQAWNLKPSEYLIAIIRYPHGYKNMDDIKSLDAVQARGSFGIRVGISTYYKPTMQEAINSFAVLTKEEEPSQQTNSQQPTAPSRGFRNSFISGPLNDMMEQRFHIVLKYRYGGMPWHGAEAFYNDQVHTATHVHRQSADEKYYTEDRISHAWPEIVTNDHISSGFGQHHSLPLVVMQFVLRHFVRCTEFCLICFNKMPEDLQAIKPYVCDNPLCLYQYMLLGFGPSIEHEILSQPKVVDLLISFCYASARMGRLQDFPTGLGLSVPPTVAIDRSCASPGPSPYTYTKPRTQAFAQPFFVRGHMATSTQFCEKRRELLFDGSTRPYRVRNGQWIVIRVDDSPSTPLHCRITDTSCYPVVRVSEPVRPATPAYAPYDYPQTEHGKQADSSKAILNSSDVLRTASFHAYSENFDNLEDVAKCQVITALLDLLPAVQEMKTYLLRKAHSPLSAWADRLPPAALGILRWIIASNRACILQVDSEDSTASGQYSQDRLYGMAGWVQFRFAMGAPDKERRFIAAVRETTQRLRLKYPTLFSWHGSPIQNWHSIIREGLHFNDTLHGRAFGNGVYHSPHVNTSLGYSGMAACIPWAMSELKIQQALALNEIVNAPTEFVSQSPHLVVAQLDWIQTRYLFVKTGTNMETAAPDTGSKPMEYIEQDPGRTPNGINGPLVIPIHAVAASRRPRSIPKQNKRQKTPSADRFAPLTIGDDEESDATDDEDLAIFRDEDAVYQKVLDLLPMPNSVIGEKGKGKMVDLSSVGNKLFGCKSTTRSVPLTDYVPGSLDYTALPMLEMPAWASSSATSRLMKDFKDLIQVQNKEPLHELGWHIDEDKIENMYQWIIELHSFDPTLPLAKDMKAKDIKSIVLEMRFGKDYPMSPPFVRVIRPRFLGFMEGGGGHITSGGAMCMELLTNDGWSAVSSIESVLLQVRMAISSLDPRPARLQPHGRGDYGVGEAVDAYLRACSVHGWTIPSGFREMAFGATTGSSMGPLAAAFSTRAPRQV